MARLVDMTGQKIGMLSVVSRAPNKGTSAAWNCLCDCGNTSVTLGEALRRGLTKSCGCLRAKCFEAIPSRLKDLTGQRFGRLIVISRGADRDDAVTWNCQCDCGKSVTVRSSGLRRGTQSCGCLVSDTNGKRKCSKQRLIELYDIQNKSASEIASLFGVSTSTVLMWLRNDGVSIRDAKTVARMRVKKHPSSYKAGLAAAAKWREENPDKSIAHILSLKAHVDPKHLRRIAKLGGAAFAKKTVLCRVTVYCALCGNSIQKTEAQAGKRDIHFCSREHYHRYRSLYGSSSQNTVREDEQTPDWLRESMAK